MGHRKNILLSLLVFTAPLSWGYEFSDGTKFRGSVDAYTFLRCEEINPKYGRPEPYVRFYAIFSQKKRAYVADNIDKEWIKLMPQFSENKIFFIESSNWYGGYRREFGEMNRTTLTVKPSSFARFDYLECRRSTFDRADSWLETIRNERQI